MKTKPVQMVKKVWGEEIWIVNGKRYCGKILILNKGFQSSLHYHRKKDETFYVLEGSVLFEWDYQSPKKVTLSVGDVFHVYPEMVHRFRGLEDSNRVIEFSTTHDDKDSFRIEKSRKVKENE
jgi:quercetin dioxygenase-like cupin family protein